MRKHNILDHLLPKVRQSVLAATILHPDRWWYMSDLAKHLDVMPSSLQRELASLVEAGILKKRQDGNRVYYQPDPQCPILPELRGLLVKTSGIADVLKEMLQPVWERTSFAFIYGSIARNEEMSASDVDLMLIGDVRLVEFAPALRVAEKQLGRAINPTLFSWQEFACKSEEGNHFVTTVMNALKIYLKGSEHELVTALSRQKSENTRHQFSGTDCASGCSSP